MNPDTYNSGDNSTGSGDYGNSSGLSDLYSSLGSGLAAGLSNYFGNPTLAQSAPVVYAPAGQPASPSLSVSGVNTQMLLIAAAGIALVLLLRK